MSPPRTRKQNANKHPGLPVLQAQGKKRSKAQKAEDDRILQQAHQEKERMAAEGLERLASMEVAMAEEASNLGNKPKPVKPRPRAIKKHMTLPPANDQMEVDRSRDDSGETQVLMEAVLPTRKRALEATESGGREEDAKKRVLSKPVKTSFRDAIGNTRLSLMERTGSPALATRVEDKKGRLSDSAGTLTNNPKFNLTGRVNGWITNVIDPVNPEEVIPNAPVAQKPHSQSRPTPTLSSSAEIPPSTLFSQSQATSNATSLDVTESSAFPKVPAPLSNTVGIPTGGKMVGTWSPSLTVTSGSPDELESAEEPVVLTQMITQHTTDPAPDSDDSDGSGVKFNGFMVKGKLPVRKTKRSVSEQLEEILVPVKMGKKTRVVRTTSSTSVATSSVEPSAKRVKTKAEDATESLADSLTPWVEKRYKSRSAYRNIDLPPQCQDQRWSKTFLPTVYLWAGSQPDIWQISDAALQEALGLILDIIYPDLSYTVTSQGSVFGITTQRLVEWRSNFGSTALAIMIDFFARNGDTNPKELADMLLDDYAYIFEDMDNIDTTQAFRSPFMLQLFATAHLHSIIGHARISALKTDLLANGMNMHGVIALCAAAFERAIICIRDGAIDVDTDTLDMGTTAQKKRKLRTPKTLNKATGKESTTEYAFSIGNWGPATAAFLQSVHNKSANIVLDITSTARMLLKRPGGAGIDKYLNHANDGEEIDPRTML